MQLVMDNRWILNVGLLAWTLCAGCAARHTSPSAMNAPKSANPKPAYPRTGTSDDGKTLRWDRSKTAQPLTISDDGLTLSWRDPSEAIWLSAQSTGRLKDGVCSWEFDIESIASAQIGVGAMLDPPNWGFFGYLGAGADAWAYDPHDGAIVTETEDLHKNLPTIEDRGTVVVTVDLVNERKMTFSVNGLKMPSIPLPPGATVIPAATLLKQGQVVTIRNFQPCKK